MTGKGSSQGREAGLRSFLHSQIWDVVRTLDVVSMNKCKEDKIAFKKKNFSGKERLPVGSHPD